jgi:hypothetical protein
VTSECKRENEQSVAQPKEVETLVNLTIIFHFPEFTRIELNATFSRCLCAERMKRKSLFTGDKLNALIKKKTGRPFIISLHSSYFMSRTNKTIL